MSTEKPSLNVSIGKVLIQQLQSLLKLNILLYKLLSYWLQSEEASWKKRLKMEMSPSTSMGCC